MSRKYKFHNKSGLYFVSFVTNSIDWKYSSARNYQDGHTILKIDSDGYNLGLTKL